MEVSEILKVMQKRGDFNVRHKNCDFGLSIHRKDCAIPDDVKEFFYLCDGVDCYIDNDKGAFPVTILSPNEVKPANDVINAGLCIDEVISITSSWYVIADCCDGNYITIDFNKKRLGRCYESFEYTHGSIGDCMIVARSFTEFLEHLINYNGDLFYWSENPNFKGYGDAFDGLL